MDVTSYTPRGSGGKRTYRIPEWRFTDMLAVLGTANQIREKLREHGYDPPPAQSIQGWRGRNAMPANWVPAFIQLMLEEGLVTNVGDLRKQ